MTSFNHHVNPECWACFRIASFRGRTNISNVDFSCHYVHRIPGDVFFIYIDIVRCTESCLFSVLACLVDAFYIAGETGGDL